MRPKLKKIHSHSFNYLKFCRYLGKNRLYMWTCISGIEWHLLDIRVGSSITIRHIAVITTTRHLSNEKHIRMAQLGLIWDKRWFPETQMNVIRYISPSFSWWNFHQFEKYLTETKPVYIRPRHWIISFRYPCRKHLCSSVSHLRNQCH